jgi:hypothetical protein
VTVGGKVMVEDGRLVAFSEADAVAGADVQRSALLKRADLA